MRPKPKKLKLLHGRILLFDLRDDTTWLPLVEQDIQFRNKNKAAMNGRRNIYIVIAFVAFLTLLLRLSVDCNKVSSKQTSPHDRGQLDHEGDTRGDR